MHHNNFYGRDELLELGFKKVGEKSLVSRKASFYSTQNISIGENTRIDDFVYLNASNGFIDIGSHIHISIGVYLFGSGGITLGDFSTISSRSALYSDTSDFSGEKLIGPTLPPVTTEYPREKGVWLEKHVAVGTNATIMPNVHVGMGVAIGAHSLVLKNLEEWGIYVGVPAKRIKDRKRKVLELESMITS